MPWPGTFSRYSVTRVRASGMRMLSDAKSSMNSASYLVVVVVAVVVVVVVAV